jgi:hypothetical protein
MLAVMLLAIAVACVSAPADAAAALRPCNPSLVYAPKGGGYGVIISRLHVRGISCRRGLRIGGAYLDGDHVPKGWVCQEGHPWVSCRYRPTYRMLRYIPEGDAG